MISLTRKEPKTKKKKVFHKGRLEFAVKSDIARDRIVLSVWDIAFPGCIMDCEELPWSEIREHGMKSLDSLLQKFRYEMQEVI